VEEVRQLALWAVLLVVAPLIAAAVGVVHIPLVGTEGQVVQELSSSNTPISTQQHFPLA
jgi:hypothetical protein